MAKDKRKLKNTPSPENEFAINPFAELKITNGAGPVRDSVIEPDEATPNPPRLAHAALYIRLAKKGRAGKTVTVISQFSTMENSTKIARDLRRVLGSGGTCYGETIELQGDHRIAAANWLKHQGFKVKGEI